MRKYSKSLWGSILCCKKHSYLYAFIISVNCIFFIEEKIILGSICWFEDKNAFSESNSCHCATVPSQVADVTKRKVTEGISAGQVTSHEMNLYSQHFLTNFDQNEVLKSFTKCLGRV